MAHRKIMPELRTLATGDFTNWIVLIVDDEPDNLAVAKKVLEFSGATVHTAANGIEGLKVTRDIDPTFILLDLSMPEMDGWEMQQALRNDPTTDHIPVIALTAHAMTGDRHKVMEAGFDGYIAKPFRLSTFMSEIVRCFRELAGQS